MAEETNADQTRMGSYEAAEKAFAAMDQPMEQEETVPAEVEPEESAELEAESNEEISEEVEQDQAEEVEVDAVEELEFQQEQTHRVRANGEDIEVTLDELKNSYSRQSDYTRKTQEIAEAKRILAERLNKVEMLEKQLSDYQQNQNEMVQQLQDPGDEYWANLKSENPIQYMIERDEFREKQAYQNDLRLQQEQMQKNLQEQKMLEAEESLKRENEKLMELNPKWTDPNVFSNAKQRMKNAGKIVGFSDEELSQITDHRAVMVLHKAAMWDELQTRKSKIKPAPVKTNPRTGKPLGQKSRTALTKAKQRLAKSGRPADAQAAFEQLLIRRG